MNFLSSLTLAVSIALSSLSLSAFAQSADTPIHPPNRVEMDFLTAPFSEWFGIYTDGKKTGWALYSGAREKLDGEGVFVFRRVESTRMLAEGHLKINETSTTEQYYSLESPNLIVRIVDKLDRTVENDRGDRVQSQHRNEIFKEKNTGKFVVEVFEQDEEKKTYLLEDVVPGVKLSQSIFDLFKVDLWLIRGPQEGAFFRQTDIGIPTMQKVVTTNEIEKVEAAVVGDVNIDLFTVNQTVATDGQVWKMQYRYLQDGKFVYLKMGEAQTIELRSEPKDIAQSNLSVDDFRFELTKLQPISTTPPLAEPKSIKKLILEATGLGVSALRSISQQTVEKTNEGMKITIDSNMKRDALTGDAERHLLSSKTYPFEDEFFNLEFREIVDRVRSIESTPEKIRVISSFVRDYIEASYCDGAQEIKEIVATKLGDCSEIARLFTALARSAGIPSREIRGIVYDDRIDTFSGHAWNEVLIEGQWHSVDAAWGEFPANAARIALDYSTGAKNLLDLFRLGLKFKVIEIKRD